MKIKICGLHPARDVQLCIDLKVDFLGFVFYEKSPRHLNLKDIQKLKNFVHGDETNERIKEIKSMGLKILKTIKVKSETDIENYKKYKNADIILFDTPGMEKSIKFPEYLISKLPKGDKFALAGSISLNNIESIANLGVNFCDLSSSLELDKQIGYKDHQKIKKFVKKVNELKN